MNQTQWAERTFRSFKCFVFFHIQLPWEVLRLHQFELYCVLFLMLSNLGLAGVSAGQGVSLSQGYVQSHFTGITSDHKI